MTELVRQDTLEKVLALDLVAHEQTDPALLESSRELWIGAQSYGDLCEIVKWAMIYSYKTTILDNGKPKWQSTRINQDRGFALTWAEFCLVHLGISESEASNKKRNWEVFAVEFGYKIGDLIRAGVQRLNVSRVIFDKGLQTDELITAVFGRPHVCTACGSFVVFDNVPPETCPECGADFVPVHPKTVVEVQDIVDRIKAKKQAEDAPVRIEGDLEVGDDLIMVCPWLIVGDQKVELPAYEVPILGKNEVSDLPGVPVLFRDALVKRLKKGFGIK